MQATSTLRNARNFNLNFLMNSFWQVVLVLNQTKAGGVRLNEQEKKLGAFNIDFPQSDMAYLETVAFGTYQLNQASILMNTILKMVTIKSGLTSIRMSYSVVRFNQDTNLRPSTVSGISITKLI